MEESQQGLGVVGAVVLGGGCLLLMVAVLVGFLFLGRASSVPVPSASGSTSVSGRTYHVTGGAEATLEVTREAGGDPGALELRAVFRDGELVRGGAFDGAERQRDLTPEEVDELREHSLLVESGGGG